jgi:myo-inositol-1(or 4)-monophosphatase
VTLLASNAPTPAQHLEAVAAEVTALAAALVRESLGAAAVAGTKSTPTDVVTETDLRSETLIRDELLVRCPGSTIIGEELTDDVGTNAVGWVVDPIDGTVNFLYDLPVVSVSIAATIDGVTVAGAVCDVVRDEVFSAARGVGARRDGSPISCAHQSDLGRALIGTGFAYEPERRREQAMTIARLLPAARDIRCMGSAALNLCWVACGRLDGYFEQDTKPYDYAAGALIAAEAGASVEVPANNDLDLTIAASAEVFDRLRGIITDSSDG